jgi:hypothetical protein
MSDQLQAERERFDELAKEYTLDGMEKVLALSWFFEGAKYGKEQSALSSSQQVMEETLTIPTAQEYLEQERGAASDAWQNGWAECRKHVMVRLKSTPASPSHPHSVAMTDDLASHFPPPIKLSDVQREARNKVCIDGHLNAALDSVMRSSSPDEQFNILGVLANTAIDIALSLQSSPKGASKPQGEHPLRITDEDWNTLVAIGKRAEAAGDALAELDAPSQPSAASGRELPEALEFANHVINGVFEGGDWDGGELQSLAVQYGLLQPTEMQERCGENCPCAENGADFPATCYRKTYALTALTGAAPADANVGGHTSGTANLLLDVGALLAGFVEDGTPIKRNEARTLLTRVRKARSTSPTAPEVSAPADKVDAERYRKLMREVNHGFWGVAEFIVVDRLGATDPHWMDDKAMADAAIDKLPSDAAIDRMRSESGKGGKL